MPTYNEYGEPVETEEERRRRLEREAAYGAAQDAEDAAMGAAMTANSSGGGGFMNAVGNYAQRRFDQAVQPFTDPTAALNRRMGMTSEEAANTEIQSTQVKTYGDGSQEEIVKRQIPAGGATPVNPADMGAVPQAQPQAQQKSPEEIARNAQALREMAQSRAAPQAQLAAVPQQLPAQGAINPNAPMPSIGQVPQPGPGVQVASTQRGAGVAEAAAAAQAQQPVRPVAPPPTTVTGAAPVGAPQPAGSVAQAGAQAQATPTPVVATAPAAAPAVGPAPAEPAWMAAANAAGTDFDRLLEVAGRFPESRASIKEKIQESLRRQEMAADAEKLVKDAASGDLKAQNKLNQALRPEKGRQKEEVTTSDYVKAYLYSRLGLSELAAEAQKKIIGKDTKFEQLQFGNSMWQVERNAQGDIVRAKDSEGTVATESTLNKLRAGGQKFGVQAFGFTGGISTVPSTGEPLQARQNSISGEAEYIHMTGPLKGQVYTGSEIPVQQRVSTQAMVDYNKKLIDFNTNPNIAGATELMKIAVGNDRGDGAEIAKAKADIANKLGTGGLAQILGGAPGAPGATAPAPAAAAPAPVAPAATPAPAGSTAPRPTAAPAPAPAPAPASTGGIPLAYTPSAKRQGESENMYQSRVKREEAAFNAEVQKRKELELARLKPPAEAVGKIEAKEINNQNYADSTYGLIKPISDAIRQSTGSSIGAGVDKLASTIGVGTQGAQNIAKLEVLGYQLLSNVPRFEGPQSDLDVQLYKQAAGDLSNSAKPVNVRLAALDSIVMMLKKYDKAGKNDWSFGNQSQMRIVKREKVK